MERRRFEGKVAIVTGSGRGIGRATAIGLAKEGAKCCITARSLDEIESVKKEISALGGEAIVVRTDVGDLGQIKNMVDRTVESFGRLDYLVNNAAGGLGHNTTILDCTEEQWQDAINGALTSVYRASHYALPHIIEAGGGAIVNVSSTRGLSGRRARVGYGSAKAGVINLTRCMALDLLDYNVRVNCVCPGHVESEYMKVAADILRDPSRKEDLLAPLTPSARTMIENRVKSAMVTPEQMASVVGRGFAGFTGYPDQLANVIIFLLSDDASFVNGEILTVDGGSSAGK